MGIYQGTKILLRPLQRKDAEATILWRNNPSIREMVLGYRFPITEVMEEKWYESALNDQSRTRVIFAMEELAKHELIGLIHLTQIDWISRTCHFGITIGDSKNHGKGYAKEGMQLLLNYAFQVLNLRKINLEVIEKNEAAIHLYRKMGFQEEGRLRKQVIVQGEYYDVLQMGLFDKELQNG